METAPLDSHVTIELSSAPADRRVQIMNYAQRDVRPLLMPADANPERIRERATELLDLGFGIVTVARRVGVQPKLLKAIMTGEPTSSAIERRIKVSASIAEGRDLDDIAEYLGVDTSIIRDDLRAMGIKVSRISGRSRRMDERKEKVNRLHEEGHTIPEMAESLGITESQVRYTMKVLGLEWRVRAARC